MKTIFFFLVLTVVLTTLTAQTPETVQLQIEDLEEAKLNLQSQIKDIDTRLNELYKSKHDLTVEQNNTGHKAHAKSGVSLFNMPVAGDRRKELARIPANTELIITKWVMGSLKTSYGGLTGYVFANSIKFENPDAYNALKEESQRLVREGKAPDEDWKNEQDRIKAEEAKKWQAELSTLTAKFGKSAALKIIDQKIWMGMTKEMMIASWGYPEDINRTVGSWGVHEQCIYGETYVYVEEGKVTAWQD